MSRRTFPLLVIFALISVLALPAGAQVDAGADEAALLERESTLIDRIGEIQTMLTELDAEQIQVLGQIEMSRGQIERAADQLEILALQRREPAIIRASVAVNQFVSGDPAQQAFALEVQALGGSGAAQDPLQQQEVFDSIVESAENSLQRLDTEILDLVDSIPSLRAQVDDLNVRLADIDLQRSALSNELENTQEQVATVTEALEWYRDSDGRSVLTGRPAAAASDRPALVVKIDNVVRARPQAGINDADVVYVELVEGGFTRYAAVFQSENVGTVGPVRSMRTTDLNLLAPLNRPLFASSGANSRTTQAVNASSLVNISAATGAGSAYFRNTGRPAPHNLFSTDSALRGASSSAGNPPELFTVRRPGTPLTNNAFPSNGVNVTYRSTSVNYTWNGSGWARTQDGSPTVDTAGVRTAPETVIVRFTPYGTSPADAASPEAITVGSGTAWIFTEGQLIEGSWSKANAQAVTRYFDSEGTPVEILPGRVWVEIPTPGSASLR